MRRRLPARGGTVTTTTRVVKAADEAPGDPLQGTIRAALKDVARLTPEGYLRTVLDGVNEPDLALHIFKRNRTHGPVTFAKVGECGLTEVDPENVEPWIMGNWGAGYYQLKLAFQGKYYHPASVPFRLGEEREGGELGPRGRTGDDTDALIEDVNKKLSHLAFAKQLKDLAGIEDGKKERDDMTGADLAAILAAMRPDNGPVLALLDAANRRAEAAEQRTMEFMRMMMEQRSAAAQGALPLVGDLLKNVKPEVWQTLMNPGAGAEGAGGVTGALVELARDLGPSLLAFLQQAVGRPAAPPPAALPAASVPTSTPAPAPPVAAQNGAQPMPIPLDPEQTMAKDALVEFVRAGDFRNAFAQLEAFPGFLPTTAGPVPFGEAILSRIDPATSPRVYVPMLAMIVPEVRSEATLWESFVKWVQDKLVADDEAARRAADEAGGKEGPA